MRKFEKGVLAKPYMGYKAGAKIWHDQGGVHSFCILADEEDEFWGWALSNHENPVLETEGLQEVSEIERTKEFYTLFEIIRNKVKIPTTIQLF